MGKAVNFRKIANLVREWILIVAIFVIVAIAASFRPAFIGIDNILNILRASSTIGLAAIGMSCAVIGGTMDLSMGSTISLTAVFTMLIMNSPIGINPETSNLTAGLTILAGLGIGAVIGFINGSILALINGRMGESFIITYAMQIVIAALAQIVVRGEFQAAKYPPGLFKSLGIGFFPIIILAIVALVVYIITSRSKFGRNLYFLGANMNAAKMAGIKVRSVRIVSHTLCSACAGLAGVLIVSRVNSASCLQGVGYELEALSCVAVGGISLTGGNGSIIKTVVGVLLIGVMGTALNVLGIGSNAQLIVRGLVIIVAVFLDILNKQYKQKVVDTE